MRHVSRPILASAMLLASSCTFGSGSHVGFTPSFAAVDCPGDIAASVLGDARCGNLTVLAHRGDPSSGTLNVFITRIEPGENDVAPDPVLAFGGDLGVRPDYESFGDQAAGLRRQVIVMDVRGSGHSQPSLLCPEIDATQVLPATGPVDSPRTRVAFLSGVQACRDRLTGQGVDASSFDLEEMAADAEDLRVALGIDAWNLLAIGTTSRIALEYLRDFPGHVRATVLDSPEWPGLDPSVQSVAGMRHAVGAVVAACATSTRCDRLVPHLGRDIRMLIRRLAMDPVVERFVPRGRVYLDAGWFFLWLRTQLSFVRPPGTFIPRAIHAMAQGNPRALRIEASRLLIRGNSAGQQLCQMLFPNCWKDAVRAWGVNLSVLCRDVLPLADPAAFASSVAQDPAMRVAFGSSLIIDACGVWDAGGADPTIGDRVSSPTPILVVTGRFDPFATALAARRASSALPNTTLVMSPVSGHQVTGIEGSGLERESRACLVRIRDAWLDNPSRSVDTSCINGISLDLWMPLRWDRQ